MRALMPSRNFWRRPFTEGDFKPNGDLPFALVGSKEVFEDFCALHCLPFTHPDREGKATAGGKTHTFSSV